MKAAYFERHGNPEVIDTATCRTPRPGRPDRRRIHAASVNGADWTVLAGHHSQITDVPYVLGRDFSAWSPHLETGWTSSRRAIRCSASATWVRKGPMPKRSR